MTDGSLPDGSLSLPARLYLLSWNTTKNELPDTPRLHQLVRAGALAELAQQGLLVDEDGIATPADMDTETGDAVLDGLLELVRESLPHHWGSWVPLHARVTLDAVRERVVAEGYLRAEKRRVLGLFPSFDYALERVGAVDALREEARRILSGPVPVAEVPERDAAVVTLAVAAELPGLGPRKERLAKLAERSGPPSVMEELRAALTKVAAPSGA